MQPSEIADDLTRILALARRAIRARDDTESWARSPERQVGHHAACCDALWDELQRLVDCEDGKIPMIEHPAVRERRIAQQIRSRIVAEIVDLAAHRLDQVISGTFAWDEPGALTATETEDML